MFIIVEKSFCVLPSQGSAATVQQVRWSCLHFSDVNFHQDVAYQKVIKIGLLSMEF